MSVTSPQMRWVLLGLHCASCHSLYGEPKFVVAHGNAGVLHLGEVAGKGFVQLAFLMALQAIFGAGAPGPRSAEDHNSQSQLGGRL